MDFLTKLAHNLQPSQTVQNLFLLFLAITTAVLLVARPTRRPSILPSPLKTTLPSLQTSQIASLPYPPNSLPNPRDVPTPYGTIRAYEFGPPTGRKVLLIHGISTSCMTLSSLAHLLVERGGCRVMLFDLFGRGYSDGVGDLPYDARLFVTQALCVLASSELAWTGSGETEGFHLMGYSLGGGIAVHLATAFPGMVRSLTLLAPAGMIRPETFGWAARVVFRSGWVPEGILEEITKWRLRRPIAESAKRKKSGGVVVVNGKPVPVPVTPPGEKTVEATLTSEIADTNTKTSTNGKPLPNELQKKVMAFVAWQVRHHAGFIVAFMSTLRHAPMLEQHATWRKLADRPKRTVCFIFGDGDQIVNEEDYREDALPLVGGEEQVVWSRTVVGGHDFPMVHPEETLKRIWEFWGWE